MFFFLMLMTPLYITNAYPHIDPEWGTHIVGGDIVDITRYPYQARLENPEGLLCGASILTEHHVLCAYNCIILVKGPLTIHTGTSLLSDPGSVHQIEANFTWGPQNDANIVVLRVKEPIIFDKYRQPIQLYSGTEDPKAGNMGVTTGWGFYGKHISNELRATEVPIVSREECQMLYNGTFVGDITGALICAGFVKEGGKDSCKGDAGGPLVINGRQAGIVSKGMGCGKKKFPGIYTNIAYYSNWIAKQILK